MKPTANTTAFSVSWQRREALPTGCGREAGACPRAAAPGTVGAISAASHQSCLGGVGPFSLNPGPGEGAGTRVRRASLWVKMTWRTLDGRGAAAARPATRFRAQSLVFKDAPQSPVHISFHPGARPAYTRCGVGVAPSRRPREGPGAPGPRAPGARGPAAPGLFPGRGQRLPAAGPCGQPLRRRVPRPGAPGWRPGPRRDAAAETCSPAHGSPVPGPKTEAETGRRDARDARDAGGGEPLPPPEQG